MKEFLYFSQLNRIKNSWGLSSQPKSCCAIAPSGWNHCDWLASSIFNECICFFSWHCNLLYEAGRVVDQHYVRLTVWYYLVSSGLKVSVVFFLCGGSGPLSLVHPTSLFCFRWYSATANSMFHSLCMLVALSVSWTLSGWCDIFHMPMFWYSWWSIFSILCNPLSLCLLLVYNNLVVLDFRWNTPYIVLMLVVLLLVILVLAIQLLAVLLLVVLMDVPLLAILNSVPLLVVLVVLLNIPPVVLVVLMNVLLF